MATVALERARAPIARRALRRLRPLAYLWSPVGLLLLFFAAPLGIILKIIL
jgi:hypothetical protein